MSKPNVLTQILAAVAETNSKVDAIQTQLNGLEDLDGLPAQLTELDTKITDIQSILSGDVPDVPDVPSSNVADK
ncbi:P10 [Maruca vitrata nucleopolyhedrovirus]|uniref:p10 n=1 Tax=Maruca vitrata nucleopolyhedrovirus TaxID=1307954 RepID=A1YRG7_9ABAC|nr:P10 [Maruca vitrata nucleopolyhedrovirus]ABM05421.1 P10 [Maruca vitrata nucleopolyhedrovirus]